MANLFRCSSIGESGAGGAQIYYLGTGTSFNIPALLPDVDYTQLTADNFIVGIGDMTGLNTGSGAPSSPRSISTSGKSMIYVAPAVNDVSAVSKTYNASTGTLKIANYTQKITVRYSLASATSQWTTASTTNLSHTAFAYLVMGEIKSV